MIDFDTVFGVFSRSGVEFIVVGGTAATIHGSARVTRDVDIDLLGEITGGGGYEALLPHSTAVTAFGVDSLCLNLDKLIQVKRAAGRPKDLEAIAELEALREQRDEQKG